MLTCSSRSNASHLANITYESQINVYSYDANNLWTAYGVAIAATLLSLGVGFHALFSNGVSYRTSFSTIVATTRNNALDDIMIGSSLGGDAMRKDVMRTKLRFGVIDEDRGEVVTGEAETSDHQRAGFGLEDKVTTLEKGKICF